MNIVPNLNDNILDLVFSNSNKISVGKTVSLLLISDSFHSPLVVVVSTQAFHKDDKIHTYIDFKSVDYLTIFCIINSYNWKNTFDTYSLNYAALVSIDTLLNAINVFFPGKHLELQNLIIGFPQS